MSHATEAPSPSRWADAVVGVGLVAVTVYGFVVVPLRPYLLGHDPHLLVVLSGSRPGLVAVGALAAAESGPWVWPLFAAILSIVKFHWVFWWAGRLWGETALERVAGDSRRARRRVARAEEVVRRYRLPAIWLTYVPVPVAREVVHVALGTAGVSFRRFLAADLLAATVTQAACVALGAWLGHRAVDVVRQYAVYAGWVALVVLTAMLISSCRSWRRRRVSRRRPR